MSSVAAAAFDVTFWLHHCNVDRLCQKYLTLNPGAMADARQLARAEHQQVPSSPDLFETAFVPFKHPVTGLAFKPAEAFTLEGLGYSYDKLLPTPDDSSELNEMPSFAVFPRISIVDLNLETFQLHVFLLVGTEKEKAGGEKKEEVEKKAGGENEAEKSEKATEKEGEKAEKEGAKEGEKVEKEGEKEGAKEVEKTMEKEGEKAAGEKAAGEKAEGEKAEGVKEEEKKEAAKEISKEQSFGLPPLDTDPEEFSKFANYAGMGSIFGGKEGCITCANRVPFSVRVNITAALNRLGKSRYDVQLGVICVDHQGQSLPLSATPLPKPEVQGPLFEDTKTDFRVGCKNTRAVRGDVKALQHYLQFYGFYDGPITGIFDQLTEGAVKKFQKSTGMPPNGIVCKTTKKWMTSPRFDTATKTDAKPRARGTALTYWVGVSPANLNRERLLAEIQQACDIWEKATGCSWRRIESWTDSDVEILWHDEHYHAILQKRAMEDVKVDQREIEAKSKFDGPGGQLAHSGFDFLHLDIAEHWLTMDQPKTFNGQFRLFHVVLHELGHVLGLGHSRRPQDLMSPFYDESHGELTDSDAKTVQALYPITA